VIRCRLARRRIDEGLERELVLEARFELDEHLAACPDCAAHARRARGLQELLERPGDPPVSAAGVERATTAVLAALERGEGEPWRPRERRFSRGARVAALALACAAGSVVWLALRPGPEPVRAPAAPPTADAGGLPVAPSVAEDAPPPAELSDEWTTASVEACVRAALLECFESNGVDETRAWQRFHEVTREPLRSGWPVRRFVEGLLESPDTAAALAAVRCLGSAAEPSAAPALERALARPELTANALEALGSLGEAAAPALERALSQPRLGTGALLQLCRMGGPRAAAALERAVRGAREPGPAGLPSREALLDALTSTGPAAVASLLRLADEAGVPTAGDAILARLPLVAGAGAELARTLERERLPDDLARRALLALRPPEALPWLEARCLSQRERGPALAVLATFEGTPPLASALRLARGGRVPRGDVLALLTELVVRDAERAEAFSDEIVERRASTDARDWLALLIESEQPAAARALVPLVLWGGLALEERQWAALALGELGTPADAERLERALARGLPADRRLLAACLLTIDAGLGPQRVAALLAGCSAAGQRRVLAALEENRENRRAGEAVRVHRVARALDGALAELAATSADTKADRKEAL
jgi:HEAT repeat protein